MIGEKRIGIVEHYYPKVHAAAVWLQKGELHEGDTIHIQGKGVDFVEQVHSMQLDHEPIRDAHAGQHIGVQVSSPVKERCDVLLVPEET